MQTFGKLVLTTPTGQEKEFTLSDADTDVTLGRASVNDIVLRDQKASRNHARIECSASGCALIDLGSGNGTRVNDERIERATLNAGDLIAIGDSTLRFESGAPEMIAPKITPINSQAELEATLAHATLAMTISNTHAPRLAIKTATRTWQVPFTQDALTIGRGETNDVALDDRKASRQHARIERRGDDFVLRDQGSTNGTFIGAMRVTEHTLRDGDTLRVGDARIVFKRGFQAQELTLADHMTFIETPGHRARRPVVIVPGLMGSELWRGTERFWPNARIFFTDPDALAYAEPNTFEPRDLVHEVVIVPNLVKLEQYGRLGDFLEEALDYARGKNLFEFAYDWRQDVRVSARQLGAAIENWKIKPPYILIAHSLGCLVSRYFVEHGGGKNQVERLLLVGGPHYGVPQILPGLLFGQGLLPFGLLGEQIRKVLVTFPSAYQILPTYPCVFDQHGTPIDVLEDETWVGESQRALLRGAREFRKELGTRSSIPTVSIFGYGLSTTTRINIQRDTDGKWNDVKFVTAPGGDDTIPDASTVIEDSEIHPVEQHHGSLYVDNDVKMRLKLELMR
ncbi:MAG: FHA domain-containing protein [Chloroflexi bacterium]|nr:FHA domain-containing protein [Chloroflexota bacterium]